MSRSPRRLAWALPALAAIALVAPTLGSAAFLDDWIYLTGARLMASEPFAALHELELAFLGTQLPAHQATHPLGAWAWLVPAYWIAGADPPVALLQLGSLGWLLLAIGGAVLVARRGASGSDAALAGWLVVACPPMLLLAHRLMPDLVFTALGAAALVGFAAATDGDAARSRRWAGVAVAAALVTAAWLVAYQALALLAALLVALPRAPRAGRRPLELALGFAVALFVAGQLTSALLLGEPHLAIAGRWFSGALDTSRFTPAVRLWSSLGYLGAFGAPALAVALARGGRDPRLGAAALVGVLAGAVALGTGWRGGIDGDGAGALAWTMPLAVAAGAASLALLVVAGTEGWRDRDPLRAAVAGWGVASFAGGWLLLPVPLARYLLPVHLACAVIAASWRPATDAPGARRGALWLRAAAAALLVVWALLGFGIGRADAARADATAALVQRLPVIEGATVFVGESGFRIAAERASMRYLTRVDPARDARLLHAEAGQLAGERLHPELAARRGAVATSKATYPAWISAVDWARGADFYFPFTGSVPFTFPGVGEVVAESHPLEPPLPDEVDRALSCLAADRRAGAVWPTSVRWEADGDWSEIHSVFTTATVLLALSELPRLPQVTRLAEPALDALASDANDDGSWCFYGRADRVDERPGRAWPITADADDTARAVLALRAWDRPVAEASYTLLAAQVAADGSVRTWIGPPDARINTDTERPDPVVAAAVLRALRGDDGRHADEVARIGAHLEALVDAGLPDETPYYAGRARIAGEIAAALGRPLAAGDGWPEGEQLDDGCWPLQPTFHGAPEAGRPAYGSRAEPTAAGAARIWRAQQEEG